MSISIYYFSATGNCLTTAKELATYYEDAKIINVATLQEEINVDSEIVAFVCPVYYGTTNCIMMNAIRKMVFEGTPYIYLLTTCKGHTGVVANRIHRLLEEKGQTLSLARNIVMPGNSWISTPEENEERLKNQKINIKEVVKDFLDMKMEDYHSDEVFKETPVDYPNNFRGIMADENCIGCGTCVKVCPMENIKLVDKKAIIGNECSTCLGCFHWCPVEAIYMSKEENVSRRFKYHHPDVKLLDVILRK